MNNRNIVRGLCLGAIALSFGLGAVQYPIGSFARAGAGLFPLLVSGLLLLIALLTLLRARFEKPVPLGFSLRNIGLVLVSLCGFALVSEKLNMVAGIVLMVFVASLASTSYSWKRCLKIAAGLVAMAFAFQKLLGLNLPLV